MYKYYMYVVYTNNIYIMYFDYIDKLVNRTGSIDNYFKKKRVRQIMHLISFKLWCRKANLVAGTTTSFHYQQC